MNKRENAPASTGREREVQEAAPAPFLQRAPPRALPCFCYREAPVPSCLISGDSSRDFCVLALRSSKSACMTLRWLLLLGEKISHLAFPVRVNRVEPEVFLVVPIFQVPFHDQHHLVLGGGPEAVGLVKLGHLRNQDGIGLSGGLRGGGIEIGRASCRG